MGVFPHCRLSSYAVKTAFDSTTIVCVGRLAEGLRAIRETQFDLALIDLGLPDGNGMDLIKGILDGRPPLSPSIAQAILKHFHNVAPRADEQPSALTGREAEVLQLIAKGCHVKEVAGMLLIANSTVSAHIKKISQKLDIHNRAEATAAAVNLNLYSPRTSDYLLFPEPVHGVDFHHYRIRYNATGLFPGKKMPSISRW